MKLGFAACALALMLAGCATQNAAGISSYHVVSADRLTGAIGEPPASEPAGTIIVKRDPGMLGAALSSILLLNGKPVALIKPGEYLQFRTLPGEHIFGVSWSDNLGSVATSSTRELAVDVRAGQTYYLRLFPQSGNGVAIERSSQ